MTPPQQIPIPIISDREGICRLTSSNRQKPSEMKVMINNTARSWVSLTVVSSNRFCLSFTLSELRSTSPKYLIPFLNVKANSKKTMRTRPTIIVHGCFGYFFRRESFGYGDYGFLQVFQRIGLFQGSTSLESMYVSRHETLGSTGGRLGLRGIGGNGGMCGGDRHDYMAAILRMFLSHTGMF